MINRDNIEQDNFDNLIKDSKIIDVDEAPTFEDLLKLMAKELSLETGMPKEEIISRYLKQQNESNKAVSDCLTIPHIIIDGEDKIYLYIIRCKTGIKFTEKENKIKAVFLFGVTRDKRMLHLKTVASMATLVQQKNFQEQWDRCKNTIELKNLMILSTRKRFY